MDILFIRHGETDWNREMRTQGGIVSIDINARGGILRTLTRLFDHQLISEFCPDIR